MIKTTNKTAITLLSGMVITGCIATPVNSYADSNNNYSTNNTVESTMRSSSVTKAVLTESVYLRASASWSAQKGKIVKKGETVEITQKGTAWSKVKSGTNVGYIANDYLKISTTGTTTSTTEVKYTGVVSADLLNVRSGSSIDHSVIGGLKKGNKVQIVSKLSNGWFKIKHGSGYGYINGKYVSNVVSTGSTNSAGSNSSSNSSGSTSTTEVKYTGVINVDALNVRSGSSTDHSIVGGLKKGNKVQIVSKLSNGWFKIKYGSGYGYINGKYVSNVVSTGTSSSTGSSSSNGLTSTATKVVYTANVKASSPLNVRTGGSTSYSILGTLSNGTKVEIVDKMSNGWSKIKYGSGYGYVCTEYLANITSVSSTNSSTSQRKNLNNFLFVGDSFTALLKGTIEANNSTVYVHAKSGSMPGYWLDKVSSMPSNSKVDGVVLLIGVNGAAYESNKTDVKTLINKLSAKYPNKTIYVQKIFPVGRNFTKANPATFNKKIATLNSVIESHCKTVSNAKFIDTRSGFVDKDGYLINTSDGLHISSSYNTKFYNNILNAVRNAEK